MSPTVYQCADESLSHAPLRRHTQITNSLVAHVEPLSHLQAWITTFLRSHLMSLESSSRFKLLYMQCNTFFLPTRLRAGGS